MSKIRSINVIVSGDNGATLAIVTYSQGEAIIHGDEDVASRVLDAIAHSRRNKPQPATTSCDANLNPLAQ